MKHILYFLLFSQVAQAKQSRFHEGETIYVWALSGLNMRKLPDAKSEKIAALPYGTKVVVQPNIGMVVAHEVEEFKDFKVKGVWLLIKYGDKEGFVFDGYMSRLVAPEKMSKSWFDIKTYIEKNFTRIGNTTFAYFANLEKEIQISESNANENLYSEGEFIKRYSKGVMTKTGVSENGQYLDVSFEGISLYEGLVLSKIFLIDLNLKMEFNASENTFYFDDNETCQYQIFIENKKLIISGGCSC